MVVHFSIMCEQVSLLWLRIFLVCAERLPFLAHLVIVVQIKCVYNYLHVLMCVVFMYIYV